jgi:hypothetical protein
MNIVQRVILIIVCVTIIAGLKIIVEFVKFLLTRNDIPVPEETSVDELVSEEMYYFMGDPEPRFKRLYKRTWSDGSVEFITSED